MIQLFINGSDVSNFYSDGSLTIIDQIQNKANTASFRLNPGVTAPSENQEVLIYDTVKLVSASSTTIIVNDTTYSGLSILSEAAASNGRGKYRVGQIFWLDVGGATEEKVTIATIAAHTVAGQVIITSTVAVVNSHSANEDCGRLIFGGVITYNKISNPKLLTDVEYQISATDFTKIFDKRNINDSWEGVDGRYIINDFFNTTINLNTELDDMEYDTSGDVQTEWIEAGDGINPTRDAVNFIQGTSSVIFPWTNSGGTASFAGTPTSSNVSELTGAVSGTPTEGNITFWYKRTSNAGLSTIAVRVGSDASNYQSVSFTPIADTEWHFISLPLAAGTTTGTPVWTATDTMSFIFSETTSSSIIIDDCRLTAEDSFTLYNVEETGSFDDVRASFKKPTFVVDELMDASGFYWFIDYERDLHTFDRETIPAPFSITDTTDNFDKLSIDVDTSQLKNKQVVRGGTKTSASTYSQVVEGDGATREWILKGQFANLVITLDDNSSTDLTEAGTTTTNITAVAHSLVTGDYIVNRTRSNAVRKITFVDNDNFTVEAVTSQTSGDTFSKFATAKTDGVEFLVDETTVDYVSNFNEKSVRATDSEPTLEAGDFLLFVYNEIIPIRVEVTDATSIGNMKALIGGDGIFDGAVITDKSLTSTQAARDRGRAEIDDYSNPITKVSFVTDHEGLESGQLLDVTDSNKGINDTYVIQKVKQSFGKGGDYAVYSIQAASSLFGIIEYFQKLSQGVKERLIDSEDEIDLIRGEAVTITITEVNTLAPSESAAEAATIVVTETSNTVTERDVVANPYTWGIHVDDFDWNIGEWS